MTVLNLRGVRASMRLNRILLTGMCIVLAAFTIMAVRFLWHTQRWNGLFSAQPFYDPHTFHASQVWAATSFAALTYIGFDGVTTLAEDARNPKRDILLATVLVCLFTGVIGSAEAYLGQRIWPQWQTFPNLETAFIEVCRRAGGTLLSISMALVLIVAAFGSGLTGILAAARLLFGMGNDGVLPRKVFGRLDADTASPQVNILLLGSVAFVGAVAFGLMGNAYQYSGELINFGAFLAFMGVNFSAFWQFSIHTPPGHKRNILKDALLPLLGFFFCASIWWNLSRPAKIFGGSWFAIGLIYIVVTTRGFRLRPKRIDFTEA
jgi:amino acid transporter